MYRVVTINDGITKSPYMSLADALALEASLNASGIYAFVEDAECNRVHNWTADEILEREG